MEWSVDGAFDEGEWAVIGAPARREGVTEAVWITARIRTYLAYVQETPAERFRVAEDEASFGENGWTGRLAPFHRCRWCAQSSRNP